MKTLAISLIFVLLTTLKAFPDSESLDLRAEIRGNTMTLIHSCQFDDKCFWAMFETFITEKCESIVIKLPSNSYGDCINFHTLYIKQYYPIIKGAAHYLL